MVMKQDSSIRYLRIGWSELEPEKGKYDWSPIDNAIANAKKQGRKFLSGS
jgi:hypothetical protein